MTTINYIIIIGELFLISYDSSFAIFWRIVDLNQLMSLALFLNAPLMKNSQSVLKNLYLYNIAPLVPNLGLRSYHTTVKTEGYAD